MTIVEIVRRAFAEHGERLAIADDTQRRTYREVAERSHRLVSALRARGVERGDRVATLGPNDITTLEVMLGLAVGGYTRTALHQMNAGDAHRAMLEASDSRALIVTAELYERFRSEITAARALQVVLVHDAREGDLDYEQALAAADPADARIPVQGDETLHLAYSSGSSGAPHAAVHSQAGWAAVTMDNAAFLPRVSERDIYLAAAPLTHAASTVVYLLVARGASIRIVSQFTPDAVLRVIEQERCTMTFMVPTMLQALVSAPGVAGRDLSSLRAVVYAGAPISVATARRAQEVVGDVLFQSYGQSQCLPVSTLTPEDHARGAAGDERILRSAGRVCLTARVRIVDEHGVELPPGAVGEILIWTRGRMRGIDGDPDATAQATTSDGFVRSNDVGRIDEDGYLFVVDRKDDRIISGGFNIWPIEIEEVLLTHPRVTEAVVVGVPHARWGETPCAVVVLDEPGAVSADELVELCRDSIGSMKKPSSIIFRTEPLPRNELGKMPRRLVRDEYWPSQARDRISGA